MNIDMTYIKKTTTKNATPKAPVVNSTVAQIELQIVSLKSQIRSLDTQILQQQKAQKDYANTSQYKNNPTNPLFKAAYDKYTTTITSLQVKRKQLAEQLKTVDIKGGKGTTTTTTTAPVPKATTPKLNDDGAPKINISATKENYFSSIEGSVNTALERGVNFPISVNDATLLKAANLWKSGVSNKGIIKTWQAPGGYTNTQLTDTGGTLVNSNQTSLDSTVRGFQFHYNPGSITMAYKGVPDVDVSMYSANIERFNLMGPTTNQSTISFSLVINRMTDAHYMEDPANGVFKKTSLGDYSTVYNRAPVSGKYNELKAIYEQGTMYDIEFFLRVLLGFQIKSALRNTSNGGLTADMGWVSPRPVELHLGNNLKYVVFIGGFEVQHVIFNDRMVPIFSTVSLTMNRVPDYNSMTLKKA